MARWWLAWMQRLLQSLLSWVTAVQRETPRKDKKSLLSREVHVPTPVITAGVMLVLFVILSPEFGLTFHHLMALAGFLLLLALFFVIYFRYDLPQFVNDDESVFLTGVCIILGVLLIELGQTITLRGAIHAVPVGSMAIVVTLLLNLRLALLVSIILSVFAGLMNHFSFDAMLVTFMSCLAAMASAQRVRTRGDILRAGFHVAWVTFVTIYILGLLTNEWRWDLIFSAKWAAVNGILCAAIPLALLPMLESFFSRITAITLLEVGDFNRPLLRRLMIEAPGTYHHTLLVSALAEQAAEAIGANSLLCRVGMYYHDVGETAASRILHRKSNASPER